MSRNSPPVSKGLRSGAAPVLSGLVITDFPSGRRTIQDGAFLITLDAQDRVRSAQYQWDKTVHRVARVSKPRRGEAPSLAWTEQEESDAYWQRVSAAFPRPDRAAVGEPA